MNTALTFVCTSSKPFLLLPCVFAYLRHLGYRLVDVERAIEKLGMTADAVVEIARNPAKEGTDIDVLRQLVIIAPTEEEEIALKRMNLRGKDATREFMWRMAEVPSVRKRIEAGITMKVFKIHTKEVTLENT